MAIPWLQKTEHIGSGGLPLITSSVSSWRRVPLAGATFISCRIENTSFRHCHFRLIIAPASIKGLNVSGKASWTLSVRVHGSIKPVFPDLISEIAICPCSISTLDFPMMAMALRYLRFGCFKIKCARLNFATIICFPGWSAPPYALLSVATTYKMHKTFCCTGLLPPG